jgi:hypothetical protein
MGSTDIGISGNTPANQLTLTRSDPAGIFYQNYVDKITDKLYALLPDVYIESFAYARQIDPNFHDLGYGKGAVCTIYVLRACHQSLLCEISTRVYVLIRTLSDSIRSQSDSGASKLPWLYISCWHRHRSSIPPSLQDSASYLSFAGNPNLESQLSPEPTFVGSICQFSQTGR